MLISIGYQKNNLYIIDPNNSPTFRPTNPHIAVNPILAVKSVSGFLLISAINLCTASFKITFSLSAITAPHSTNTRCT
ncbi:MAG: hypothetical protein KKI09_02530, partial [Spirochaetes bacterium]|nr:hypothetical protein [Spirochaetota bacterium]